MPRAVPHAWKNTGDEPSHVLFLYTPAAAGKYMEERVDRLATPLSEAEAAEMLQRHGWEIVGPSPL